MYRGMMPGLTPRGKRWTWLLLGCMALAAVFLSTLGGCAMKYEKGTYSGAVACVDVTGPGFSWKCTEQSKVPPLPDGQYVPEPKP